MDTSRGERWLIFENREIDLENLPQYQEVTFRHLPGRAVLLRIISSTFTFSIIFAVLMALPMLDEEIQIFSGSVLPTIGFAIFLSLWTIWAIISHRYKGFAVRDHDILYKAGVIRRHVTILPVNRVQHIEFHRSFLERRLGLSSLYLYTAGGSSADMGIRGMLVDEAEAIRGMLLQRIQDETLG